MQFWLMITFSMEVKKTLHFYFSDDSCVLLSFAKFIWFDDTIARYINIHVKNRHGDLSHINDMVGIHCSVTIIVVSRLEALTMYSFLCLLLSNCQQMSMILWALWRTGYSYHWVAFGIQQKKTSKIAKKKKKKKREKTLLSVYTGNRRHFSPKMEIYVVELSESIYHFNFDLVFIIAIIRNQIAIKCDSKVLWLSSHVHLIWLNFMRVIQMQTGKK